MICEGGSSAPFRFYQVHFSAVDAVGHVASDTCTIAVESSNKRRILDEFPVNMETRRVGAASDVFEKKVPKKAPKAKSNKDTTPLSFEDILQAVSETVVLYPVTTMSTTAEV